MMILATIIFTAIASALHGSGRIPKIAVTMCMAVYVCAALYLSGAGLFSLAGVPIAAIWRFATRAGRQAHAEMQAMDTRGDTRSLYEKVVSVATAHWYNPFGYVLGFIIALWLNYDKVLYSTRFFDTRRYVELASGALPQASVVVAMMWGVLCL